MALPLPWTRVTFIFRDTKCKVVDSLGMPVWGHSCDLWPLLVGRPGTSTHAQSSWASRELRPGGLHVRTVSTSAVPPRARQLRGWRGADPELDDSPGFRERGRAAVPLFPCPSFATESTPCRGPGTLTPPPRGGPCPGVPGPVSLEEQLGSPNFCPRALLDPWYLRLFPCKIFTPCYKLQTFKWVWASKL